MRLTLHSRKDAMQKLKSSVEIFRRYGIGWLWVAAFFLLCFTSVAAAGPCPPFYLKTDDGKIINPMSGDNADQPYSTRQTCGSCHPYEKIREGYHFDMGWKDARDNFIKDKPWFLTLGMTGGF